MKYRYKEITEATQWNEIGDHPGVELMPDDLMKIFGVQPDTECQECGKWYEYHGCIGKFCVCPGDMIITCSQGDFASMPKESFDKVYEKIDEVV